MKAQLLLIFSILSYSANLWAMDATALDQNQLMVKVSCNCLFTKNGIERYIVAHGQADLNPEEMQNCPIVNGRIEHSEEGYSCLSALEAAYRNCQIKVSYIKGSDTDVDGLPYVELYPNTCREESAKKNWRLITPSFCFSQ